MSNTPSSEYLLGNFKIHLMNFTGTINLALSNYTHILSYIISSLKKRKLQNISRKSCLEVCFTYLIINRSEAFYIEPLRLKIIYLV